jgi:hypothetical protein
MKTSTAIAIVLVFLAITILMIAGIHKRYNEVVSYNERAEMLSEGSQYFGE